MADDEGRDWSAWEQQTFDEWDSDSSEERIQNEKDRCKDRLWSSFENSASAVAHMYKDGSSTEGPVTLWLPFKNAASAITLLYKDGQEIMDKCFELGCQMGSHRKSKDYMKWLKTKKRKLAREEIVGYICGKHPPVRPRPNSMSRTPSRLTDRSGSRLIRSSDYNGASRDTDHLDTFKQAIAMRDLDGAMSNFGIRSTAAVNSSSETSFGSRGRPNIGLDHILEELNSRSDSRKRSAASDSFLIDSPSRKRSKLQ